MSDVSAAFAQPATDLAAAIRLRDPDAYSAAAASGTEFTIEVHKSLDGIAAEWRRFEAEADRTPFQSCDRLAKWQAHIGARRGVEPAVVAIRGPENELIALLPLSVEKRRSARRLRWLASDLCDYNAPVLAKRFAELCPPARFRVLWRETLARLRSHGYGFDLIDLAKMPARIGGQANPLLVLPTTLHPNRAYATTFAATWDAFYASKRSSSTRRRERRQLRQLADHGEVRFMEIKDLAEADLTLDTLFRQKARALERMGVPSPFEQPGLREFFRDLAGDPALHGAVHLTRLDVGPTIAAISLGLILGDCYYLVLSSYDDGPLSRLGPGRAHLYALMDHAIGRGLARFDFTIGDEPYKRDWSDTEIVLHDHLAAATLLGWPARAAVTGTRRAKRFIKENPAVWHAVSRARALSGGRQVDAATDAEAEPAE